MKRGYPAATLLYIAGMTVMAVMAVTAIPALAQRGAARPQVVPPEGPVWQVIRKNCSGCHGIDDNAFHALDRAGWQALLDAKHKGRNVEVSGNDRELLLDWLVSKFGPESRPFPRTYVPPEITTFFTDLEGTRLMTRACESCHDLQVVNNSRFAADRWRVILVTMRQRGAVLNDEELERMVEWLGRTKGINPNQ
jgi:cytochrome c5